MYIERVKKRNRVIKTKNKTKQKHDTKNRSERYIFYTKRDTRTVEGLFDHTTPRKMVKARRTDDNTPSCDQEEELAKKEEDIPSQQNQPVDTPFGIDDNRDDDEEEEEQEQDRGPVVEGAQPENHRESGYRPCARNDIDPRSNSVGRMPLQHEHEHGSIPLGDITKVMHDPVLLQTILIEMDKARTYFSERQRQRQTTKTPPTAQSVTNTQHVDRIKIFDSSSQHPISQLQAAESTNGQESEFNPTRMLEGELETCSQPRYPTNKEDNSPEINNNNKNNNTQLHSIQDSVVLHRQHVDRIKTAASSSQHPISQLQAAEAVSTNVQESEFNPTRISEKELETCNRPRCPPDKEDNSPENNNNNNNSNNTQMHSIQDSVVLHRNVNIQTRKRPPAAVVVPMAATPSPQTRKRQADAVVVPMAVTPSPQPPHRSKRRRVVGMHHNNNNNNNKNDHYGTQRKWRRMIRSHRLQSIEICSSRKVNLMQTRRKRPAAAAAMVVPMATATPPHRSKRRRVVVGEMHQSHHNNNNDHHGIHKKWRRMIRSHRLQSIALD